MKKIMKKLFVMASVCLLVCCSGTTLSPEVIPTEPPVDTDLPENPEGQHSKDWYLGRVAEVGITQKVPLIQVAYRDRTRKIFLESANFDFVTAREDCTTIFQACSVTKTVFSYICMLLLDEGILELDKPLYEYTGGVVDERFKNAIPGNAEASAQNEEWAKLITARIVLTHGTGLPNWAPGGGGAYGNAKLVMSQKPDEAGYTYSGEGICYLQRTLEHITGLTLDQLGQKYVFGPLGMKYSSFDWRDDYNYKEIAAYGYSADMTKGSQSNTSIIKNSAASLRTNVVDFSLFLEALMEGRGLKPETYKEWLTPQRHLGTPDFYYGLGVRVASNIEYGYGPSYTHGGSNNSGTGGFRCHFWVFPQQQTYCVYFTNSVNGGGTTQTNIYNIFLSQFPGGNQ
ncbi:hypothetical protein AGMMS4956_12560 [Bacteroidia bacterium]|nr:hypothetical protein AGMMS4956_12560 [Bacteroidia bacterium]